MKRILISLAPLALTACVAMQPPTGTADNPAASKSATADAAQGALALLPVLDAEAGPTRNVFFSPASIDQAFGMLRLGAAGSTRAQIDAAMPPPRNPTGLESKSKGVEVRLANALWLSDRFRFRPTFVDQAARDFRAAAQTIDVRQPEQTAQHINDWAAKSTDGLISQVVTPNSVTPDTAAFLTNALFFDGLWHTAFDGAATEPFLHGDGRDRPFLLMRQTMSLPLVRANGMVGVRLGYTNPRYAMDVVIPETRRVMTRTPTPAEIASLGRRLGAAKAELVDVRLPQFEIDYDKGLIPALQAIGLTLPFADGQADFSAMAEPGQRPLVVDDVQHIAKLQVFDTGTRAAAVTTTRIVLSGSRLYKQPPVPFVVDRPFLVVIRDLDRGEILFLGRIADPKAFSPRVEEE